MRSKVVIVPPGGIPQDDFEQAEVVVQSGMVEDGWGCPECGNPYADLLAWNEWGDHVTCLVCGAEYNLL